MTFISDVPDAPGKPEAVDITKNSVTLKWLPPDNDGGNPIFNYVVESKTAKSYKWLPASQNIQILETSFVVKDLLDGVEYEFRTMAENKAGLSAPSSPSEPIMVKEPISKFARVLHVLFEIKIYRKLT